MNRIITLILAPLDWLVAVWADARRLGRSVK